MNKRREYTVTNLDCKIKTRNVVGQYNSYRAALSAVEEFVLDRRDELQGNKEFKFFTQVPSWRQLPHGMFIVRDLVDHSRSTMYFREKVLGYVYNSYKDHMLYDISVYESLYDLELELPYDDLDDCGLKAGCADYDYSDCCIKCRTRKILNDSRVHDKTKLADHNISAVAESIVYE